MESIRVNNGVKVIEVNDEGEAISLPLSDDRFVRDFYNLANSIKQKSESIAAKKDVLEALDETVAVDEQVRDEVDKLIGADTCRKVFGSILPSLDMFTDFFMQLLPIIDAHTKKRVENMNKYSAARTGSV